ncbi:N-acetyltransferase family protein [Leptolyngbyaceae cyanobacterium UHCC 1019]
MTLSQINIRTAVPGDEAAIFSLIRALAAYENLTEQVTGSEAGLRSHLFSDRPYAEAILAEINDSAVGFALFFYNYSTFLTKPGIYLEDLFVLPNYRSQGIGKALLVYLAQRAIAQECGRLEWSVLDWNEPAIGFYQKMGATLLPDWRICRVTGDALGQMALGKRTNS